MKQLQVGYGKVKTTPEFSVGLAGYSDEDTRKSTGVLSDIYITCIAATEGEETVLLYTVDMCGLYEEDWDMFREAIYGTLGIPRNRIFIGTTHTHTAPGINEEADGRKYIGLILGKAIVAAQAALADRAPAAIESASGEIEGMNFVRHYLMKDGTYAGPNFGNMKFANIVDHAYEADKEMTVVKFNRGGGEKKDVVLVNWQAHPDNIGGTLVSSDYVGVLRDELERLSGTLVAYFTGADGDMSCNSWGTGKDHGLKWEAYGIKLGQLANEILAKCQPLEGQGIAATSNLFPAEIDHSLDHKLKEAREAADMWKKDAQEGHALAKSYGFTNALQARMIVSRAPRSTHEDRETSAIRIGGLGIISCNYEMSSTNGRYIKDNSPFKTTLLMTGNHGYIPEERAYGYGAYEAITSLFAKGVAEKLADEYVRLLNTLK